MTLEYKIITHEKTHQSPEIVLLHGLRGAPVGLADIKKSLENLGYIVHTPPVPPFAEANLNDLTPQGYANYFRHWIQEHSLKRPVLIGHSMGSLVVASIAHYYPESINKKVILLSPISERANLVFRIVSPLASFLPSRIVDYVTTKFLHTGKEKVLFRSVMKVTHECGNANQNIKRKNLKHATSFSVKYGIDNILKPQDNPENHFKICLIAGENDRLISQKSTKNLQNTLKSELFFIPQTGHLHNYEKPTETAQLIDIFLKES